MDIGISEYNIIHIDKMLGDKEAIKKIPMALRRRLSSLDRGVFASLLKNISIENIQNIDHILIVSRYGNISRLISILKQISIKEDVSPAQFSTSVHNTLAGMICMAFQKNTPTTSIAAKDKQHILLTELAALYKSGCQHILALCYDHPQIINDDGDVLGDGDHNFLLYTAPMSDAQNKLHLPLTKDRLISKGFLLQNQMTDMHVAEVKQSKKEL